MKRNKPKTKTNDYAVEFLKETIPHFAADPEWRNIFIALANLSEVERAEMLRCLESNLIPIELISEEQRMVAFAFLRVNLEMPDAPHMMVKMIDYENLRVKKISKQEVTA